MINKYFALTLVAASVAMAGCSSDDDNDEPEDVVDPIVSATPGVGGTAFDQIATSDAHTTLLAAIQAAGLDDLLDNPANAYTIFAPTNAAFDALDADEDDATPTTDDLLTAAAGSPNADLLARILSYHAVSGDLSSEVIVAGIQGAAEGVAYTTASLVEDDGVAQPLTFALSDAPSGISVNEVNVTSPDFMADADAIGRTHVIDQLLMPPAAPEPTTTDGGEGTDGGTDSGGTDGGGTDGGGTVGENSGTAQAALESAGTYSNFIAAFNPLAYDDPVNAWTIFAPNDTVSAGGVVGLNHIVSTGIMTEEDLLAAGTISVHSGNEYAVAGTAGAVTVGGFPISLLATGDGGALLYTIGGVLP